MKAEYQTEVIINQKKIPLNPFVQNFYTHTLLGSIQALHDIPSDVESLTITIQKVVKL